MFYFAFVLGTAPGPLPSPSDSTLSLAAAQAMALERNPRIRAAGGAVAAAQAGARQAGAMRDPTVVLAREQTGEAIWQNTALFDQPLELFGQRSSRAAAARARTAVAEQTLAATTRTVQSEVAAAFAAAQATGRSLELADSILAAFGRAEEIIAARLAEGDASGYEARRLRLEAARYLGAQAEAESRKAEAYATLDLLLGRVPGAPPLILTGSFTVAAVAVAGDSLVRLAAYTDGRVVVAAAQAAAAQVDLTRLRRERIPIVSLGLGYKHERAGGPDRGAGYLAQLSMPIPLWGSRGAAVAAGAAEAERLGALAQEATLIARRDVLAVARRAEALARHHAALAARLGPEAEVARRSAEVAFAEGEMTLVEWLDGVRAFHEASVEEANLVAEFVARMAELERLTGLTLLAR